MLIKELQNTSLHDGYKTVQWPHGLWDAAKYCINFMIESVDNKLSSTEGDNFSTLIKKRISLSNARKIADQGFLDSFNEMPKIKVPHADMITLCDVMLFCYDLFSNEISRDSDVSDKCIIATGQILNNIDSIKNYSNIANKKLNPSKNAIISILETGLNCIKENNWSESNYCCSFVFNSEEGVALIEIFDTLSSNMNLEYLSFTINDNCLSIIDQSLFLDFLIRTINSLENCVFGSVALEMSVNDYFLFYHSLHLYKKYFVNDDINMLDCCDSILNELATLMKDILVGF